MLACNQYLPWDLRCFRFKEKSTTIETAQQWQSTLEVEFALLCASPKSFLLHHCVWYYGAGHRAVFLIKDYFLDHPFRCLQESIFSHSHFFINKGLLTWMNFIIIVQAAFWPSSQKWEMYGWSLPCLLSLLLVTELHRRAASDLIRATPKVIDHITRILSAFLPRKMFCRQWILMAIGVDHWPPSIKVFMWHLDSPRVGILQDKLYISYVHFCLYFTKLCLMFSVY